MTTLDEPARRLRAVLEHMLATVPDDDPAHIDFRGEVLPDLPAETLGEYLHPVALEEERSAS
jgi:hypothetical protein